MHTHRDASSDGGGHATPPHGGAATRASAHIIHLVVNPLSGERQAASYLVNALLARFGSERVTVLSTRHFSDGGATLQRSLRDATVTYLQRVSTTGSSSGGAKEEAGGGGSSSCNRRGEDSSVPPLSSAIAATAFHPQDDGEVGGSSGPLPVTAARLKRRAHAPVRRPCLVVAGGDGTVAFCMALLDRAFPIADPSHPMRDPSRPAIAVLPLGTGNDLAASLGAGTGFTEYPCGGCAFCCCCCPVSVDRMLLTAVSGRVVELDRWEAVVTFQSRREGGPVSTGGGPTARLATSSGDPSAHSSATCAVNAEDPGAAATGGASRAAPPSSTTITEVKRFTFTNYFSAGFDAGVSMRFDEGRRASPKVYRSRMMNKAMYGLHSAAEAIVGVSPMGLRENCLSVDETQMKLPTASEGFKALIFSNLTSYAGTSALWPVKDDEPHPDDEGSASAGGPALIGISPTTVTPLMSHDKNAGHSSARGGGSTSSVSSTSSSSAVAPVSAPQRRNGGNDAARGARERAPPPPRPLSSITVKRGVRWTPQSPWTEDYDVPLSAVRIDDGRLELQTVGGFFHLGLMQLGVMSGSAVCQGSTFRTVVEDPKAPTAAAAVHSRATAPPRFVALQADGEPLGFVPLPFRIDVALAGRSLVHMTAGAP